jgi:arylsulfatase A-like enzyme
VHQSFHGWNEAQIKDPANPKGVFSLTRGALDFIETHRDRPFFVYLSHYAIHTALEARPETLARFQKKPPGRQHRDPLYAACLYDLDASVGQLLRRLDELGLADNTLVVFTSDNGGTQRSSQEPLRGNKGGYYEGGIREPFLVRWPGVTAPGSRCDVPVINVDLFPTFLAAAGAPVPAGKILDGESLLPLLRGEKPSAAPRSSGTSPGYLNDPVIRGRELDVRTGFRTRPVSVIRQGDWKLHLFHEEWQLDGGRARLATNGAVELYHLGNDMGEHTNLATREPAKRDELLDALLAWMKSTNALLPVAAQPEVRPRRESREEGRENRSRPARAERFLPVARCGRSGLRPWPASLRGPLRQKLDPGEATWFSRLPACASYSFALAAPCCCRLPSPRFSPARRPARPLASAATVRPPNVLLLVADDLGYADVGFNGGKTIPTPISTASRPPASTSPISAPVRCVRPPAPA